MPNGAMMAGLDSYSTKYVGRIMGCIWKDQVSNYRLLHKNDLRPITIMIQLQLCMWLFFPEVDPTYLMENTKG